MIRKPVFAGSFYPMDKENLEMAIEKCEKSRYSRDIKKMGNEVVGVVSPHAGIVYSGPVAINAYKLLKLYNIKTVVVIGIDHQGFSAKDVAIWAKGGWDTPFGTLYVDENLSFEIIDHSRFIEEGYREHGREHSIEVQLPFIYKMLGRDVKIVPIMISSFEPEVWVDIGKALAKIKKRFAVIASSDLSHYHLKHIAEEMDKRTIRYIENIDIEGVLNCMNAGMCEACGISAIISLMKLSLEKGVKNGRLLCYANSGDTYGGEEVVGYSAISFELR